MNMIRLHASALAMGLLLLGNTASAGPAFSLQALTNNSGATVSMTGEWGVVGAPTACTVDVYRFNYATKLWALFQTLAPNPSCGSGTPAFRGFGDSISISHTTLVIGAQVSATPGTVHIYELNAGGTAFELITSISSPFNTNGIRFGDSVSIAATSTAGEHLVAIGMPGFDRTTPTAATDVGRAYFYTLNGTTATLEGFAQGSSAGDQLGFSVTTNQEGNTLQALVGVPGQDVNGQTNAGALHLYTIDTTANPATAMTVVQTLTASSGPSYSAVANEELGREVSFSADLILGSTRSATGSAYAYAKVGGTWETVNRIADSGGGDVSQSVGLSAFGIRGTGVDFYHHVEDDEFLGQATFTGSGSTVGRDIRLYKDTVLVNDELNTLGARAHALYFPCGFGGSSPANTWQIVSLPCDVTGDTVDTVFNASGSFGTYGVDWWVYAQDGGDYTSGNSTVLLDATDIIHPGINSQAYWIYHENPGTVYWYVDSTSSNTPSTTIAAPSLAETDTVARAYAFTLPTGNLSRVMIGNPFPRDFTFDNVFYSADGGATSMTLADAATAGYISSYAYVYDPTVVSGQPYRAVTATPGFDNEIYHNQGFWMRVGSETVVPVPDLSNGRLLIPLVK